MPHVQSITSAEDSLSRRNGLRMRRYLITMGIRCAGLVGAVMTDGWVRWVCVAAAVVLPYVAVVLGNESESKAERAEAYHEPQPELEATPDKPRIDHG